MLARRLRRSPNINTSLFERVVFAGHELSIFALPCDLRHAIHALRVLRLDWCRWNCLAGRLCTLTVLELGRYPIVTASYAT